MRLGEVGDWEEIVNPGEVGEICTAGDVVAAGYLGDASQTAACFVLDNTGRRVRSPYCTV